MSTASLTRSSLMAQMVKHLPVMKETWILSLGREDLLEKEMATTPVLLSGKFHRWRSLVGYSPWGCIESDTTKQFQYYAASLTTPKPLTVWITTNWKILQEMEIPDHLTCLLRNLYAGQEATVRTGHGTIDWFQIGKIVHQGCIVSPCLFNLYAEYIMWNTRLEKAQAEIKISRRNINNLRYADDTTLMAESEVELKSLLMTVKEESE